MSTQRASENNQPHESAAGAQFGEWTALQMRIGPAGQIALKSSETRGISSAADRSSGPLVAWPAAAVVLALFYGVFAYGLDGYQGAGRDKLLLFWSGVVLIAGLVLRRHSLLFGSLLIALGTLFSFYWTWTGVLPILGTYVLLGASMGAGAHAIEKRWVFGVLAALITAAYAGLAVGVGTLIGSRAERNLILPVAATAAIAVLFQPIRARLQRFADRLVYGKRATPYEVLADFAERVGDTYATEVVLSKMAAAIQEGTGASRAEVWLRSGNVLRLAASSPTELPTDHAPIDLTDGELSAFPGVDDSVEVRHQGELLGAFTVTKPPGESVTAVEDELLRSLASQAGLVMRNVGLNSEVLARLEELKASRQRLVAAQDQERRRLERNLHDGAQQHLVALKVKLRLVERTAADDNVKSMLTQLGSDADDALESLRDLARGIYPPLLADQGLATALAAQARKAHLPVQVHAQRLSHQREDVESAVYFCCLEALQNVAKHAHATHAEVRLSEENDVLGFSVHDDGRGFDSATTPPGFGLVNMVDRIEALGGTLTVHSSLHTGTIVTGRLPIHSLPLQPDWTAP